MRISSRPILCVILAVVGAAGCANLPQGQPTSNQSASVWINQTSAIQIDQVFQKDSAVYIQYRALFEDGNSTQAFYAVARWDDRTESMRESLPHVPLEFIPQEQWPAAAENYERLLDIPLEHWVIIRNQLTHQWAPDEIKKGAVLGWRDQELLLYYDENNQLQMIDAAAKPEDVEIVRTYSPQELVASIKSSVTKYLQMINAKADRLIITVPMRGEAMVPFLYMDLKKDMIINLEIPDPYWKQYSESRIKKGLKSAEHVIIDSHLLGMLTRPVSSSYRLFTWGRDLAYDTISPKTLLLLERSPIPPLNDGPAMDLTEFEKTLDQVTEKSRTRGSVDFMVGGDEYFPKLTDAVMAAQESIDLRTFIFDNDDFGVQMADHLIKKANEDKVDIKVLLDGMGQIMGEGSVPSTLPAGYVPPGPMEEYLQKERHIKVRVRPNYLFKADHIKTTVIDEELVFTGGMNIGREYRYDWHDLMMAIRGPAVEKIRHDFDLAWTHAGRWGDVGLLFRKLKNKLTLADKGDYPSIRLLYTKAGDPQIYKAQLAAIRAARQYIYIENSYFSDNAILYELIKARRRGVDVRVILPDNGNHQIMNKSNIITANIMLRNGIRVFFYPGMSHVKAAILDGWMCAGTANFDKLSLKDNLELNIATSDQDMVERLKKNLFERDFEKSKEMTEPLKHGLGDRFAEMLADQL